LRIFCATLVGGDGGGGYEPAAKCIVAPETVIYNNIDIFPDLLNEGGPRDHQVVDDYEGDDAADGQVADVIKLSDAFLKNTLAYLSGGAIRSKKK